MPGDTTTHTTKARRKSRWWILVVVVVLVAILASLRTVATLWTDELWFSSQGLRPVWNTLFDVKVGLFATFGAIFFVLLWVNLVVADRIGPPPAAVDAEDELVRRYQRAIRPHAGWVYAGLALVLALIAATGTIGQWQNWLLFSHATSFPTADPQFHENVGFYVFDLPFLGFLVNWFLISTVVVTAVVVVFHYLNGGIAPQRPAPRVRPAVKAHLSVLIALIAVIKAAGYFLARYELDLSHNGYVDGAGYTDVHARLPALSLLFWVCLAAAAVALWNIRRQGWTLPVLAVGIWAFLALAVGVVYPAVFQALKVAPAQSTLEAPYIARNIAATRTAYDLNQVHTVSYPANQTLTASQIQANAQTLSNIRLWDPGLTLPTFQQQQVKQNYYTFESLAMDRYVLGGQMTPAIVAVRQVSQNLPAASWVNSHLEYTHGEGMVLAPANSATSGGLPEFDISGVPPASSTGAPKITQPAVYFGENQPGFVIADSKQGELDYQNAEGSDVLSHYRGSGGVVLSSFWKRAAFAIRLGDLNVLDSNLITSHSRIMFVRDIQAMAEKAAPFLTYDSDPYPVVVNGHIDWVINAYTTSNQYPYSESANSVQTPPGSNLPSNTNYVRNSVDVVINAYSGKMTFYAMDPSDPILRAYESAFPTLFTPASKMGSTLANHLRYGEDMFGVQAAMYGRYHITSPGNFYTAGDAWVLSPTAGSGSPSAKYSVTQTTTATGQVITGPIDRMSPEYQVLQRPGGSGQSLTLTEAYIPASNGNQTQRLTAFMMAEAPRPGAPDGLYTYVTSQGGAVVQGPAQVDATIQANAAVSQKISLLNQNGSRVLLGSVLLIPVDNTLLYARPLYVESSRNPYPQLREVITVLGQSVGMEPTLSAALSDTLGYPVTGISPNTGVSGKSTGTPASSANVAQAAADLAAAKADYQTANKALAAGNLAGFQQEVEAAAQETSKALQLLGTSPGSGSSTSSRSPAAASSSASSTSHGSGLPATAPVTTTKSSTTTTTLVKPRPDANQKPAQAAGPPSRAQLAR